MSVKKRVNNAIKIAQGTMPLIVILKDGLEVNEAVKYCKGKHKVKNLSFMTPDDLKELRDKRKAAMQ